MSTCIEWERCVAIEYGADVTDGSVENYDLDWPEPVQPSES